MDSDKKMIIDGVSVIGTNVMEKSKDLSSNEDNAQQQRLMKRKRRLIIVSLVTLGIVICIFIAAIILFSLWTSGVKLQEKKHRKIGNKDVDEELYQDKIDSVTSYHVQDNNTEFWVILDYNRELEIMKVKNGESTTCYVSIRDPSKTHEKNQTETNPLQTTTPGVETKSNEKQLPIVNLRPSNIPIVEKSMLGRRGQQMCQDVQTFWILSTCDPSSSVPSVGGGNAPLSRVRRATWQIYSCYWDWTRCHYITFVDSTGYRYYACDWTCGFQTYEY